VWQLLAYVLAWGVIVAPYEFWQRLFIAKFSPASATEFFVDAAAAGYLRTMKAFLERGVDVNAQSRNGTALHGAAFAGELEAIDFLISRGADVNAINAYGDSPLANAMKARKRANGTQALLAKHGGKLVRGTTEQRDRVIAEEVRKSLEELDKEARLK
jgi:ankyrin repeat protein